MDVEQSYALRLAVGNFVLISKQDTDDYGNVVTTYPIYIINDIIDNTNVKLSMFDPDATTQPIAESYAWSNVYIPIEVNTLNAKVNSYALWPFCEINDKNEQVYKLDSNCYFMYTTEYYKCYPAKTHPVITPSQRILHKQARSKHVLFADNSIYAIPSTVIFGNRSASGIIQPIQCNQRIVSYAVEKHKKYLLLQQQSKLLQQQQQRSIQQSSASVSPLINNNNTKQVAATQPAAAVKQPIKLKSTSATPLTQQQPTTTSTSSAQSAKRTSDIAQLSTDSPLKRPTISPAITTDDKQLQQLSSSKSTKTISVVDKHKTSTASSVITPLPPQSQAINKQQHIHDKKIKTDSIKHERRSTYKVDWPNISTSNLVHEPIVEQIKSHPFVFTYM